jgi:cell shape-determining protein MreD
MRRDACLLPMPATERRFFSGQRLGMGAGAAVAVTLILVFLHFVLRLGLGVGAWAPDLLTVALLLSVRRVRFGTAAAVGFTFGILEDAFALVAFGANTLAMTVVGILGAQTRVLFVTTTSLSFQIIYFAAGKWLRDFIHWMLQQRIGLSTGFLEPMVLNGVPAALYAALAGLLFVRLVGPFGESES